MVVLTFSSVAILSSCGPKPELDLENAAENLEDEKYSVDYDDDCDEAGIEEYLRATNGKDDYLYVTVYADAKLAKLAYKELQMEMKQEKEYYKLQLEYYEYMLDEYGKELESEEEDYYKEEIKEYEKYLEEFDEYVIGRSGNTVWSGTKTAIEDSKG